MRDWDEHRLILTLHRCRTLRATGDALGVTHTTVARRLSALEDGEPTPIFKREGRVYRLTPYGLERLALAEKMEALDYAATRLQKGSDEGISGPITLSVPQAVLQYLLLDEIGNFIKNFPGISLSVIGTDRLADLDRGEADVVIRGQSNPPDHLIGRRVCTVGLHNYAHRDYLENNDRNNLRWISSDAHVDWIAHTKYGDCPIGLVVHDIQSRFLALKQGLGLSRAACFMADRDPNLIRLDDTPPTPLYGLWVLTHPDLRNSPKIKALMKALTDALVRQKPYITGEANDI